MDKQIFLIGNAHLDPVWLWKRREGFAEIKATFQSALDRMKKNDGFIFSVSAAAYYKWVEENEPAMFEEIKRRIAEGRWVIVGGMWVQPDCNLPSGESFVRQFLYSQRYFMEKFGRIATVGYNVDSFGHNGMLPQLLRKAGLDSYVYMRPSDGETELPHLFSWESPDGSRVTAYRIKFHYGDAPWLYSEEKHKEMSLYGSKVALTREFIAEEQHPCMLFYGVGNHGGGPTARCLEELDAIVAGQQDVIYSHPAEYFAAIENTLDLPVVSNDLQHCASGCYAAGSDVKKSNRQTENRLLSAEKYDVLATQILGYTPADGCSGEKLPVVAHDLQHHASGCYSAGSFIKKSNRQTENRLLSAEKYGVLASQMMRSQSNQAKIQSAYEKLMFNQFHDILCGCCVVDALEEANRYFNAAWAEGEDVAEFALQKLSWNVNTSKGIKDTPSGKEDWVLWETEGQGAPIVVFNPHSFPVKGLLQINHGKVVGVTDKDGNALPYQSVRGPQSNFSDTQNIIFTADIPALGYSSYYIYTKEKQSLHAPELDAGNRAEAVGNRLENPFVRVEFDAHTGTISSMVDKRNGVTMIDGGGALPVVIDDSKSDTWAHMVFAFDKQIGTFSDVQMEVVCNGPLLATIRITSHYNRSTLVQEFSLNNFNAELTVKCRLDFHEQRKVVKFAFPVAARCESVVYEMPFGFIRKNCDGLEEPCHRYASLSGERDGNTVSLALINDCKYSFSAHNNELRMMIARGCGYADQYGELPPTDFMDQGRQDFTYVLLPHCGESLAGVTKSAMILNQPIEHIMETNHEGTLDATFSGISVSADNVVCDALKFAESEDALVLRLYETSGIPVDAEVRLYIPGFDVEFAASFGKHEVKTVMLYRDGSIREVNLIEY